VPFFLRGISLVGFWSEALGGAWSYRLPHISPCHRRTLCIVADRLRPAGGCIKRAMRSPAARGTKVPAPFLGYHSPRRGNSSSAQTLL